MPVIEQTRKLRRERERGIVNWISEDEKESRGETQRMNYGGQEKG